MTDLFATPDKVDLDLSFDDIPTLPLLEVLDHVDKFFDEMDTDNWPPALQFQVRRHIEQLKESGPCSSVYRVHNKVFEMFFDSEASAEAYIHNIGANASSGLRVDRVTVWTAHGIVQEPTDNGPDWKDAEKYET